MDAVLRELQHSLSNACIFRSLVKREQKIGNGDCARVLGEALSLPWVVGMELYKAEPQRLSRTAVASCSICCMPIPTLCLH